MGRRGPANQTAEARRRISRTKRVPLVDRVFDDAMWLSGRGSATRYEYADAHGVSPQTAYNRLRRVEVAGQADSWIVCGRRVFLPKYRHGQVWAHTREEVGALKRKYGL